MPLIALNNSQKPLQNRHQQSTLVAEQINSTLKGFGEKHRPIHLPEKNSETF